MIAFAKLERLKVRNNKNHYTIEKPDLAGRNQSRMERIGQVINTKKQFQQNCRITSVTKEEVDCYAFI